MLDGKAIGEKVVVGVVSALVLGGIALFWNWSSGGGMIRALGGVTKQDLVLGNDVPRGAVLAFDRDDLSEDQCPLGWRPFLEARGRTLVGAGDPEKAPGKMAFDDNSKPLTRLVLRQHGGQEESRLTERELPSHTHVFQGTVSTRGGNDGAGRDLAIGDGNDRYGTYAPSGTLASAGQGLEFSNMPPFIALYYCKKD